MSESAPPPSGINGNGSTDPAGSSEPLSTTREIDPIDAYSAFIVRGTIIGTGLFGLALFLRNSRLFATYQHVKQIPEDFYRLGIEMKGVVKEITPNGWLHIEHRPFVRLPRLLTMRRKPKTPTHLNLKLAGLDISPVGIEHLKKDLKLVGRPVIFSVIKQVEKQPDGSDADVTAKKALRKINLNTELVRKGYARVFSPDNPEHLKALQLNANYSRLITRLLTSEQLAERRGLGIWERSSWVERIVSYPDTIVQIIKHSSVTKFAVLIFHLLYDLCSALIFLAKQMYYLGETLAGYSVEGYRRFARFIDRLNSWYFRERGSTNKAIEQRRE